MRRVFGVNMKEEKEKVEEEEEEEGRRVKRKLEFAT